jgi:hypothetical protein
MNLIDKIQAFFRSTGDREQPQQSGADFAPRATPAPVTRRVCLITFDPPLPNGSRLVEHMGWNDPDRLVEELISDLREVSHGYANYEITERLRTGEFPPKEDGFRYTAEGYLAAWQARRGFHQPDTLDYRRLSVDYDLNGKVERGEIDEVWLMGFPYAGFYESRMLGPGSFWCNAPPLEVAGLSRRYVVMGFNFERGVGEALESYGHRAESIMARVYRRMSGEKNLWERFIRHQKTHPGRAEVGNVHYAPNSRHDYDWGNPAPVPVRAHTWVSYPALSGQPQRASAQEWGGGDMRAHHRWWFQHMPHFEGETDAIANNWWLYIVDPNQV